MVSGPFTGLRGGYTGFVSRGRQTVHGMITVNESPGPPKLNVVQQTDKMLSEKQLLIILKDSSYLRTGQIQP